MMMDCWQCFFGYSLEGFETCELCPDGSKPTSDRTGCEPCPAGTYASEGAEYCAPCGQGRSRTENETLCVDCEPGRYNSDTTSATCTECPGGRYSDTPGSRVCQPCPVGRYYNGTGSNASSVCSQCPGGQTQSSGAYHEDACLQPGTNQSVECIAGKTCSFVFSQGPGLLDTSVHAVKVKEDTCEPDPDTLVTLLDQLEQYQQFTASYGGHGGYGGYGGAPPGSYGGYGGLPGGFFGGTDGGFGGYGGFGFRRLKSGEVVDGFGTSRVWIATNYTVAWTDPISADPGNYKLCWCGGYGFYGFTVPTQVRCVQDSFYDFEVGTLAVAGPYPGQTFSCVRGRVCNGGTLKGLGLTADDQLHLRAGCTLDGAKRFAGVPFWVSAVASDMSGEVDLEFGLNYTVNDQPGSFSLCWCSSKGTPCSTMDLSVDGTSDVYLETFAGMLSLEGPFPGAEVECFLGQYCYVLLDLGGENLLDGDRLTALSQCGDSSFLTGFPSPGYTDATNGGLVFIFDSGNLNTEPGIYRMCWCRPDPDAGVSCDSASDFGTTIGLFLATGPYSGQTAQCELGSECVLSIFQGVSLSTRDSVVAMASCKSQLPAANFPSPLPLFVTIVGAGYGFNLGQLKLEDGVVPEKLELCWCSSRSQDPDPGVPSCSLPWHFGAAGWTLYLVCPPGWYELVGVSKTCQQCPPGYYCAGGWGVSKTACPAGSTSDAGASKVDSCKCRRGYYVDVAVGACMACPAGSFKNSVDRLEECAAQCPAQTTSAAGAASIRECFCDGHTVDVDPNPGVFQCEDLADLSNIYMNGSSLFASSIALVHSFNGSIMVLDASTEELLEEIRSDLSSHIQLSSDTRASFELEVGNVLDWRLDFQILSSDPELADQMHSLLKPAAFAAWIYTEMGATALSLANLTKLTDVEATVLQCPDGLGFPAGSYVTSLADCVCPHGMQPADSSSSGLLGGCTSCPAGTFKSSVKDTSCEACPTGQVPLTTLQQGAVSDAACTCSAGYHVNEDPGPEACLECDSGYFCLGGHHREPCSQSRTTDTSTAGSESECLCDSGTTLNDTGQCEECSPGRLKGDVGNAPCTDCTAGKYSGFGKDTCDDCNPGRFSSVGAASCEACPAGRYSQTSAATSLASCALCSIGTWSNDTGADTDTACRVCPGGTTTEETGSTDSSACVRPYPDQARTCVSGRVCAVDGLEGHGLRAGHRMGIASASCLAAKVAVPGIVDDGISKISAAGSRYVWGDLPADFTPSGGFYNLCWCANMEQLVCTDLNANYLTQAGQLLVAGPSDNFFECVRGRDCVGLLPFSGFELVAADLVSVRRDACGTTAVAEISSANTEGIGNLSDLQRQESTTSLTLGFGVSDDVSSYYLSIDVDDSGYFLCWCASGRGAENACTSPEEFIVYAGRLRVVGPRTNQESGCSVGQPCSVLGIQGAGMEVGDRLMVLSDCGRGIALLGFPSSGIMETSNAQDFAFVGNSSDVLLSTPGIFRLCFCRPWPSAGETCERPKSFQAKVGLMTASGPFDQIAVCSTGSSCTLLMSGIGLLAGDQVLIVYGECGQPAGVGVRGFPQLEYSVPVVDGSNGLEASLGELPAEAMAGDYKICWCPANAQCGDFSVFRAPGGTLRIDCPPGSYAIGPATGQG